MKNNTIDLSKKLDPAADAANGLRRFIASGKFKMTRKLLGLDDLSMLELCQKIMDRIWEKVKMTEEEREKFNL